MAYRLYHESLRENCGIQQILEALGGLGETLESGGNGASLENEDVYTRQVYSIPHICCFVYMIHHRKEKCEGYMCLL